MASETTALPLALLIGVSLGALGSGGSIVTLPLLVYVADVDPKSASGIFPATGFEGGITAADCSGTVSL